MKTPASGYSFITKERTQQLDLLQHLVANIARAIVVCGPEGVGKTRLLTFFQEASADSCIFCTIQGDAHLSYETIRSLLHQSVADNDRSATSKPADDSVIKPSGQKTKIVLVIDDAGKLSPGLLDKLIALVNGQPALRCILALTHSELYLKNSTDPAIEDCYQIEIPPLSEKQCGEFLEYLSALPRSKVQFDNINETSVAELYRETHGIPGNILKSLPQPDTGRLIDYSKPVLLLAVIGLIAVALGVQWWSARQLEQTAKKDKIAIRHENNPNALRSSESVPVKNSSNVTDIKPAPQQSVNSNQPGEPSRSAVDSVRGKAPVRTELSAVQVIDIEKARANTGGENIKSVDSNESIPPDRPADPVLSQGEALSASSAEGDRWVRGEPAENYTLQLMALPDEETTLQVIQRNRSLGEKLRYIKTKTKTGKDRFILIYGSYLNSEDAKKDANALPKEFRKFWTRRIKALQQELFSPTFPNTAE